MAAPSRGARRAPAAPAPGPRARRCGPAAAPCSGPHPRHYTIKVNRKARRAALRSALSVHAGRGSLAVFDARRVRRAVDRAGRASCWTSGAPTPPTLVLLVEDEANAGLSFRNLDPRHRGCRSTTPGVADVIGAADAAGLRGRPMPALTRARGDLADGWRRFRWRFGWRRISGPDHEERSLMDASQIIIRPVVSEKSFVLAEAGKYTFRVADKAHKTQIRQAVEELFDVKVSRSAPRRSSPSPSAAARPPGGRGSGRRRSCRCARATRSRSSKRLRPRRGLSHADS